MKLIIIVKSRSKQNKVVKHSQTEYSVYTTKPAIHNFANLSVIDLLSKYLDIPKSRITIIHGAKSRRKTVNISQN